MTQVDVVVDDLVEAAMRKYGLPTKREAVEFALRRLVGTPVTKEFLLSLQGLGWGGDLDEMRGGRVEALDDIPDIPNDKIDRLP